MYIISFKENNQNYYVEKTDIKNNKIFIESKTLDKNKAKVINSFGEIIENYELYTGNKKINWYDVDFIEIETTKTIYIKKELSNYWNRLNEVLEYNKKSFDDIEKIVINKKYINKEEFKKICMKKFIENNRFGKEDNELPILIGKDFILAEIYDDYQNYFIKLELPIEK